MKILNVGMLLAGALAARHTGSIHAASYKLQASADVRILSIYPAVNFLTDFLSVYSQPGNVQRTLLQFDLSGVVLADDERLSSATLSLVASTTYGPSGGQPTEIYRVIFPWTEGSASWLNRDATHAWIAPGGDYVGWGGEQPFSVSTQAPLGGQTVEWDVTELVNQWLEEGIPNYGMLLLSYHGNGLTFGQREAGPLAARPTLALVTASGVPRLHIEFQLSDHRVQLWWRGVGTAALQEVSKIGSDVTWSDTNRIVTQQDGKSWVTVDPAQAQSFFRLRAVAPRSSSQ